MKTPKRQSSKAFLAGLKDRQKFWKACRAEQKRRGEGTMMADIALAGIGHMRAVIGDKPTAGKVKKPARRGKK